MERRDLISGIILFCLGLAILLKSLTYPIGTFHAPGGGLFPLLAAIILMGLTGALTIQALLKKNAQDKKPPFFPAKETPKRILLGLIALVGFRYLLPVVGFAVSTFLFILFLAKYIANYGWRVSIFFSVLTALLAYYLFQVWLKIPMPQAFIKM